MRWKSSKPGPAPAPNPVEYHDGLIPTDTTNQTYPEVVPEHYARRNEKPYPEYVGAPITPGSVSQPRSAPSVAQHSQYPYLAPGIPRTSGQAWSDYDGRGAPDYRRPWYKRPIVWVVIVAFMIIAALAGILGGVASGSIKTALSSNSSQSQTTPSPSSNSPPTTSPSATTTTTPTSSTTSASTTSASSAPTIASVKNPECPGSANLNYTITLPVNGNQQTKTFQIQCAVNYSQGDIEKLDGVPNLKACIDLCAAADECIAVIWRFNTEIGDTAPVCWLKKSIGKATSAEDLSAAVLWQKAL